MNASPQKTERDPLEVELLATREQRRASVNDHLAFLESIATRPAVDPIDLAAGEETESEVTP